MVQRSGGDLKQAASAISEQTDREDLRTMANMYKNNLDVEMRKAGRYSALLPKTVPFSASKDTYCNERGLCTYHCGKL